MQGCKERQRETYVPSTSAAILITLLQHLLFQRLETKRSGVFGGGDNGKDGSDDGSGESGCDGGVDGSGDGGVDGSGDGGGVDKCGRCAAKRESYRLTAPTDSKQK